MLLDGLAGPPDGYQDEGIGEGDDGAGDDVAEEEEADDVAHGQPAVAGGVPVDAARRAVGLGAVLAPAAQRPHGKHHGIAPHRRHQQTGMPVGELVTWRNRGIEGHGERKGDTEIERRRDRERQETQR